MTPFVKANAPKRHEYEPTRVEIYSFNIFYGYSAARNTLAKDARGQWPPQLLQCRGKPGQVIKQSRAQRLLLPLAEGQFARMLTIVLLNLT